MFWNNLDKWCVLYVDGREPVLVTTWWHYTHVCLCYSAPPPLVQEVGQGWQICGGTWQHWDDPAALTRLYGKAGQWKEGKDELLENCNYIYIKMSSELSLQSVTTATSAQTSGWTASPSHSALFNIFQLIQVVFWLTSYFMQTFDGQIWALPTESNEVWSLVKSRIRGSK